MAKVFTNCVTGDGIFKAIYICKWNESDILEVHTSDSLWKSYINTNLFDKEETLRCLRNINDNDVEDNIFLDKYLELTKNPTDNEYANDKYINVVYCCDHFTIEKIQ